MAAAFEQKSKQQAEDTEQAVKHAFEKHESALLSALSESEKKTSAAIAAQHQRLRQTALKSWMAVVIPVSLTLLLGAGAIATMSWYITGQIDQIASNHKTLEHLKGLGGEIQLNQCGGHVCAKIDESAPTYEEGYRILKGR